MKHIDESVDDSLNRLLCDMNGNCKSCTNETICNLPDCVILYIGVIKCLHYIVKAFIQNLYCSLL